jgi:hypothetical protein
VDGRRTRQCERWGLWPRALWAGCVVALTVSACRESVTAPGACPEFCPAAQLRLIDTVLTASVHGDDWARGYFVPEESDRLQIVRDSANRDGWALIRFFPFADSVTSTDGTYAVQSVDSFQLSVTVLNRAPNVDDLTIVAHRLPVTVDKETTLAEMVEYFRDSTVVGTQLLPDTTGVVSVMLPGDAFPSFVADSLTAAVGMALQTDSGGFVDLASVNRGSGTASLLAYVTVDSAGVGVSREDARLAVFDTFVAPDLAPPSADALAMGGIPSARAFLRLEIPAVIMDSSDVVRATLVLVPDGPVQGGPGDSVLLRVFALTADLGPKSPFSVPTTSDTVIPGLVAVPVGSTDSIRLDITHLVRPWQSSPDLPRAVLLLVVPEAGTLGEIRLHSSRSVQGHPGLRLTYVPLLSVGGS